MPIVRIDDDGNDISTLEQKKREESEALEATRKFLVKKKLLKQASLGLISGLCVSTAVFVMHDQALGIFLGVWAASGISFLNLLKD